MFYVFYYFVKYFRMTILQKNQNIYELWIETTHCDTPCQTVMAELEIIINILTLRVIFLPKECLGQKEFLWEKLTFK